VKGTRQTDRQTENTAKLHISAREICVWKTISIFSFPVTFIFDLLRSNLLTQLLVAKVMSPQNVKWLSS